MATRVIVGVDRTAASLAALHWAAAEARLHDVRLHVVSDLPPDVLRASLVGRTTDFESTPAGAAVAEALVAALDADSLLVLGLRRRGRFASLLARSTVDRCLSCAPCPVVVVPTRTPRADPQAPHGPVVVGVDGSPGSRAALRAGAREARIRGVPLLTVYALYADYVINSPSPQHRGRNQPAEASWTEADNMDRAEAFLRAVVDDELGDTPGVRVLPVTVVGQPDRVVAAETSCASLMCLGARGTGRREGTLVGSVAARALANPGCPVLLVPPTAVSEP